MKVASLDLGSNTFLLLVASVEKSRIKKVHKDISEYVRLGEGVQKTGVISSETLQRVEMCFEKFKKILDKEKPVKIQAVATSAARDAQNKKEFLDLSAKFNFPVEIISGEREAELTFLGCVGEKPKDQHIVIDVGGYSTEVVFSSKGEVFPSSLDVGAVRLMEMFSSEIDSSGVIREETLRNMKKALLPPVVEFAKKLPRPFWPENWAVGGTPLTLQGLLKSKAPLDLNNLRHLIQILSAQTLDERRVFLGEQAARADVISQGALILEVLAENLGLWGYQPSSKGVRFGLALSLV